METVQHDGSWWRQDDDGTWYRWNETAAAWEFAHPPHEPAPDPAPVAGYRSPGGLARALTVLLGTNAVLDLAAAVVFFGEFGRWDATVRGTPVADAAIRARELQIGVLSIALFAVLLATIPVFLVWFHRLYTNLPPLGATLLRFSPGWAIGSWFVPLLNLWRPKQIANDIWRASDPALDPGAEQQWRGRPVAAVVHLWWAVYLTSNLVNQAVVRFGFTAKGADQLRTQALAETAAAVLDAIAALIAMWLVVQMTRRQEDRAALVHPL